MGSGVEVIFLLDDLAYGIGVAIAVKYQEFDAFRVQRMIQQFWAVNPVTMCYVAGVAQCAVDQCDVVLVIGQYGYGDAMAPVQFAFLANL